MKKIAIFSILSIIFPALGCSNNDKITIRFFAEIKKIERLEDGTCRIHANSGNIDIVALSEKNDTCNMKIGETIALPLHLNQ